MANNQTYSLVLDPTVSLASVFYLHPSETLQKLVNEVFSGSSYGDWKRSVTISLQACNKLRSVTGSIQKPSLNHANYKAWERVNSVVIDWSIGALDVKIGSVVV